MEKGVKGFACLGIALPYRVSFSGDSWEQDNMGNLRSPSEGGFRLCRSFGKIKRQQQELSSLLPHILQPPGSNGMTRVLAASCWLDAGA